MAVGLFFLLGSLTLTRKKGLGGLGHLPKIALLRGCFGLKSFGGEVVKGKKILFQTFFKSFNGWLVSN
jgi:hypothetical protein